MKLNSKIYLLAVIGFAIIVGFILTVPDQFFDRLPHQKKNRLNYLWHKVQSEKKLVAITHNNSTGYFIYKGRPMGLHYDLLNNYCKSHNFDLKIIVEDDMQKAINMINRGKADVLAIDLTYTKPRKRTINFTVAHGYNHQVLVQRVKNKRDSVDYITSILELEGKKVYIQKGTVFKSQLEYLQQQTGADFEIIEDGEHTMEDLIIMVSNGDIDYTACDERVAKANKTYMPNVDYRLIISAKQKLCWAVPPHEDSLKININNWMKEFVQTKKYAIIERTYFTKKKVNYLVDDKYLPGKGGQLSPYDDLIKKYAETISWDWRLLASLIYQESRFNPQTVSWAGAKGLMQIMPETAKRMGVQDIHSPENNIKAGVKFLRWIDKQLPREIIDSTERIKFALAAYNVGLGHVLDARRLAEKNHKNPNQWIQEVDTFILLKSKPKYYHDPVVKYGYCRGRETYDFVREILTRYHDYENLVTL